MECPRNSALDDLDTLARVLKPLRGASNSTLASRRFGLAQTRDMTRWHWAKPIGRRDRSARVVDRKPGHGFRSLDSEARL